MNCSFVSLTAKCALVVLLSAVVARGEAPYDVAWSRQIGTTYDDYSFGVAVDAAGSAYITGYTYGSLGGPNAGGVDAFLTKYDGAGNFVWSRQIGTTAFDSSYGVAVDGSGNAYISGYTDGSLGGPNAGYEDAFLAKYDGAGDLVWSRQIGTTTYEYSLGVAVDATGNAFITGRTSGSLGGTNAGYEDAFLVKYDGAGNFVWSRQIGTTAFDASFAVALDAAGNPYIAGHTGGSLGGPNAGLSDAFLTKYDGAGNLVWSRQIGTTTFDYGSGVVVDAAGNAYISGYTTGSLGGPPDAFLTKYDSAGNLLWSRQVGTATDDYGYDVATDAAGNVFISGRTLGSLGGPNAGNWDAFLVKLVVPEPSSFVLAAVGILGLGVWARGGRKGTS